MASKRKPQSDQNRTIRKKREMFWLDSKNPKHQATWDIILGMKEKRQFNPSVIDGIRLIADLREGNIQVLFELFPLIRQMLDGRGKSGSGDDSGGIGKVIELLQGMQQPARLPNNSTIPYASQGIPAWVALTPGGMPESEPEVELKKDTSKSRGTWNALIASAALSGSFDHLRPDILAYGIEIGKIPKVKTSKPKPQPKGDGNSKQMDVPQFAAPTFEDDDDLPLSLAGT